MIRKFCSDDLPKIMEIWLNANLDAHSFISENYWKNNYDYVKNAVAKSEVYVFCGSSEILGFIGLEDNYIAGIFVRKSSRCNGIGKQLLDFAKLKKKQLTLEVYEKNSRAVNFYIREGFVIKSSQTDKETCENSFLMSYTD